MKSRTLDIDCCENESVCVCVFELVQSSTLPFQKKQFSELILSSGSSFQVL